MPGSTENRCAPASCRRSGRRSSPLANASRRGVILSHAWTPATASKRVLRFACQGEVHLVGRFSRQQLRPSNCRAIAWCAGAIDAVASQSRRYLAVHAPAFGCESEPHSSGVVMNSYSFTYRLKVCGSTSLQDSTQLLPDWTVPIVLCNRLRLTPARSAARRSVRSDRSALD